MEANEFLSAFVKKHVGPIPYTEQKQVAKRSYIPVAIATASQLGITRRELEKAAGGNLQKFFENAMEDECDAQIKRNAPRLKLRLARR